MLTLARRPNQRLKRRLGQLLVASLGAHALVFGVLFVLDQLKVPVVSEPAVMVTFVDFSALPLPPPPPPPPPKKKSTPTKVVDKTIPTEDVAPAEIPTEDLPAEETEDEGVEGGVEGGVAGGVVGGVLGGVASGPPPPPVRAAPVFEDVKKVRANRIAGNDPAYPPGAINRQIEGTVVAKITIDEKGHVTDIKIVQTHPAFERVVRSAIAGWRFRPHIVGGRAVSVYSVFHFVFKLS